MLTAIALFWLHDGVFYVLLRLSPKQPIHVLFIGNSYTHYYDTPTLVEKISYYDSMNNRKIIASSLAISSMHLNNHVDQGVLKSIAQGKWDYVILQDCSFCLSLPFSQEAFESALAVLIAEIRAAGATPVLVAEWAWRPGSARYGEAGMLENYDRQQEVIIQNTQRLAQEHGVEYISLGEYWRTLLVSHPTLNTYLPDEYHQNLKGAYLNALVYYHYLTATPMLQDDYRPFGISVSDAEILVTVAASQKP